MNVNSSACRYLLDDGSQCINPIENSDNPFCHQHNFSSANDLEIFRIVTEHFRQDLELFWTRTNFYLVAEAALLSVLFAIWSGDPERNDKLLGLGICIVGLIIAVYWAVVLRGALYWIRQWRQQVIKIDRVVNRFQSYVHIENHVNNSPLLSPSFVTSSLPMIFLVIWLILIVVASFMMSAKVNLPV